MTIDAELQRLLAPTATNAERVRGLLLIGLPPAMLASATKSSVSTVRNWSSNGTQPRLEAAIVLDDLRMTARTLLEGLDRERVALWFTSRDPDRFDGMRPIEMIAHDPMDVLAAAQETLLDVADATATGSSPVGRRERSPTLAIVVDED